MNKEIMSEEAFNELITNIEVVSQLTLYGRKNIKYYFEKLQKENQQLKENNQALQEEIAKTWAKLDKKEKIIDKAGEYINKTKYSDLVGLNSYSINEFWFIKELLEILEKSDKQ